MADEEKQLLRRTQEQWVEQQQLLEKRREEQEQQKTRLQQEKSQLIEMQKQLQIQQQTLAQQQAVVQQQMAEQQRAQPQASQPPTVSIMEQLQRQVQSINFFTAIGTLSEFKIGEDWSLYQERLVQYFIANNVAQERRVALLITLIGQEAYKILKDLCDPVLPESKTFEDLCSILKKQFEPRISVFKQRIEFYDLKQTENETINEWFARIKNKAIDCKFGAQLDEYIKDKFVAGLRKGSILNKVCEEEHTSTLLEILEAARKREAALATATKAELEEMHYIKSGKSKVAQATIQKTDGVKGRASYQPSRTPYRPSRAPYLPNRTANLRFNRKVELKCRHCGETKHDFARCKYRNYTCKICSNVGHLAKVCNEKDKLRQSTNSASRKTEKYKKNEAAIDIIDLWKIESYESVEEPVIVNVEIEGQSLPMEIDSGAGRSVIPKKVFLEKFSHCKLKETPVRLRMYDGTLLTPEGQILVKVKKKESHIHFNLIIVKRGCKSLMGRDLMKLLGIKISPLNFVEKNDSLTELLKEFKDLFTDELGKYKYEKIDLKLQQGVNPIFVKPRALPLAFKDEIGKRIDDLKRQGVIELVENSAWGTPLVPVIKKDGTIRICADYKITVNKYIEDVKHPLPRIEELFAALSGGKLFTKLDLTMAYNQLEVSDETSRILAWSTHKGIYIMKHLPFGTKPACSIFQKVMEKTLQGLNNVINFLDDIVITGKDEEEHLKNLKLVFKRLSDAGFKVNVKKSVFFQREIKYLGHIINKDGLYKDPEKVKAIVNAPQPKNVSEVRALIGMINYYAKFIPSMSDLLYPLYDLLRKKEFKWTYNCEKSFRQAKEELSSEQNLVHFNKEWTLKLVCDASKIGIGAVLLHVLPDGSEKPISFASRVFHESEKNYSVVHKEALAIYWAVCKYYQYLMGNEFILCSDHKPLLALFGEHKGIPQMAAGRLQRWALFLSGFTYKLQYLKGEENGGADGLSRLPIQDNTVEVENEDYFHFVTAQRTPINAAQIRNELRRDKILSKVFMFTRDGWPDEVNEVFKPYQKIAEEISIENNVLMWGYRLIIPEKFQASLLEEIHGTHLGIGKMKAVARQYFWWPGLDKDIEHFVGNCEACKVTAKNPGKAPLIKFREANFPFERIHIDFAGPFKGKTYLIVIDAFTKWPEIMEMSNMSAESTIEKLRECFARFGLPCVIFSDNGRQFVSSEFANFCKINNIHHQTSAPYHPQTNGLAENAVGSFKKAILKALADKENTLPVTTLINRYLATYRNSPHASTGESPSKLMLGREVRTRLSLLNESVREKAREKQIQYFKGSREISFTPGETVYARDYKDPTKPTWKKAIIKKRLGDRTYICETQGEDKRLWKRHVEQLVKTGCFFGQERTHFEQTENPKTVLNKEPKDQPKIANKPNERPKRLIKPIVKLDL